MLGHVATVRILTATASQGEACDAIAETLRNAVQAGAILDWCYVSRQYACPSSFDEHGYASPQVRSIPYPYNEGDCGSF